MQSFYNFLVEICMPMHNFILCVLMNCEICEKCLYMQEKYLSVCIMDFFSLNIIQQNTCVHVFHPSKLLKTSLTILYFKKAKPYFIP